MPYAECSDGVRIYYEVEGSGPPIYFQHGLGSSHASWRDRGYVEALGDRYQLILVDARGHGQSDKPHDVDPYRKARRVLDIPGVLDDLGLDRAIFWGYSMGSRQGFAALQHVQDRLQAAILGGSHPYNTMLMQRLDEEIGLWKQGAEVHVAWAEARRAIPFSERERRERAKNDGEAFVARLTAYGEEPPGALAEGLESVAVPTCVYCGTDDLNHEGAKRAAAAMPGALFHSFAGFDHAAAAARVDVVLPVLRPFLERLARGSGRTSSGDSRGD